MPSEPGHEEGLSGFGVQRLKERIAALEEENRKLKEKLRKRNNFLGQLIPRLYNDCEEARRLLEES